MKATDYKSLPDRSRPTEGLRAGGVGGPAGMDLCGPKGIPKDAKKDAAGRWSVKRAIA